MASPFSGRWSLLAFGFAFAFFSAFGQTAFIAVFGGALRAEFDLSHGAWGSIYFLATLTSGLLIIKAGGLIDSMPLRRYAMATVVGLGIATLWAGATPNAVLLTVALFLLRFFGQGLMAHVALTTMAREFDAARGRAIAIATMGFPAGEAVFPFLGAVALGIVGWRGGWFSAALICFAVVLPLAPLLLGSHGRHVAATHVPFAALRFLLQRDMLLALPALMTSGFVSTAIAFHQVLIAEWKGWPATLFAASFAVFGLSSIAAALGSGWLVDRFGARRLALGFLIPSAAGCLILAASSSPLVLFAYMALHGITNGSYATVTTSLLAEAYGTERLGSIRATAASVMVVSTALSPLIFGVLVDAGMPVDALIASLGVVGIIAAALLRLSTLTRRAGP